MTTRRPSDARPSCYGCRVALIIGLRTFKGYADFGAGVGDNRTVKIGGCHACPVRCHIAVDLPQLEQYGVSRYQVNTYNGNSSGSGFLTNTSGNLPMVGSPAQDYSLVKQDLSTATLASFAGKKKILNIFASLDTAVCATSIKKFHEHAMKKPNIVVLNISMDLPFAAKRFCGAEGVEYAVTLSAFRSSFGDDYGLKIIDGPLAGLCPRAVIVLDEKNHVLHTEQLPEIGQEPDYQTGLGQGLTSSQAGGAVRCRLPILGGLDDRQHRPYYPE